MNGFGPLMKKQFMELGKVILFIHRKLTGDLNEKERQELSGWLSEGMDDGVERDISKIWSASASYKKDFQPDVEQSWRSFSARLATERAPVVSVRPGYRRWLAAAATVLLLVVAGALWWMTRSGAGAMEIVTTAGSETKELILPDQTRVFLNEHSRIAYSRNWEKTASRVVELMGEAFFEVTPDPEKPFEIQTDRAKVRVLGTAFNLRAYPEESYTEIAVMEGTVRFSSQTDPEGLVLQANEVGRLDHRQNTLVHIERSAANAQSWRTQELSFRNTPMVEVAEALQRHFNIDIRFENVAVSRCSFNSDFEDASLEEILAVLEIGLGLEVQKTDRNAFLLSGGKCLPAN